MAPSHYAYLHSERTALGTAELAEDLEIAQAPPEAPRAKSRRVLACMVGIAILGTALVASVRASTMTATRAENRHIADAIQKSELSPFTEPCAGYTQIPLSPALHSNLGNTGPDKGDEGIVFPGVYKQPGHENQTVLVVVNATKPLSGRNRDLFWWAQNYFFGFVDINKSAGETVHANVKILDFATRNPLKIRELYITFADIDGNGQEVDYIKIKKPDQYFLTKGTVLDASEGADGYLTFKGTQEEGGLLDLPHARALTVHQKNKAVTIRYNDVDNFDVEMGTLVGNGLSKDHRPSLFAFRALLNCDAEDGAIVPGVTAKNVSDKNCLFTIPLVDWCFPKFWENWHFPKFWENW